MSKLHLNYVNIFFTAYTKKWVFSIIFFSTEAAKRVLWWKIKYMDVMIFSHNAAGKPDSLPAEILNTQST